jgi:Domain of unknown function (DUF4294)
MKFIKILYLILFFSLLSFGLNAQDAAPGFVVTKPDGTVMMATHITPEGDSILYCELRPVEISAPRVFANVDEYKRYERYQRYAAAVVPYAVEAVKTYRELEAETRNGTHKERKKYISELEDKLNDKFKEQLKNLTRTQGFLLIKMIEREIHMPFYDLVKDVKGGFYAVTWNEFGKFYGYSLKDGYQRGNDLILDSILDKYDLSYYFVYQKKNN